MPKRIKSPILLTAFLCSPFVVLGVILGWIVLSLRAPEDRAMVGPAVGAGAGDTGGANAFGEFLSGRDPDEVRRRNESLRSGSALDPADLPAGFVLEVEVPGSPDRVEVEFLVDRAVFRRTAMEPASAGSVWTASFEPGEVPRGGACRVIADGVAGGARPLPLVRPDTARDGGKPVIRFASSEGN